MPNGPAVASVPTIVTAAVKAQPGVVSWKVDAVARDYIVRNGYPEYPHALGHQVGRAAHDGGVGLLPRWERYGRLPYGKIEAGHKFKIFRQFEAAPPDRATEVESPLFRSIPHRF